MAKLEDIIKRISTSDITGRKQKPEPEKPSDKFRKEYPRKGLGEPTDIGKEGFGAIGGKGISEGFGLNIEPSTQRFNQFAAGMAGAPPANVNQANQKTTPSTGAPTTKAPVYRDEQGNIVEQYRSGKGRDVLAGMRLGGMMGQKYSSPYAQLGAVLGGAIKGLITGNLAGEMEYKEDLQEYYVETESQYKLMEMNLKLENQTANVESKRLRNLIYEDKLNDTDLQKASASAATIADHFRRGLIPPNEQEKALTFMRKHMKTVLGPEVNTSYIDAMTSDQLTGEVLNSTLDGKGIRSVAGYFMGVRANGVPFFVEDDQGRPVMTPDMQIRLQKDADDRLKNQFNLAENFLEPNVKLGLWDKAAKNSGAVMVKGKYNAFDMLKIKSLYEAYVFKEAGLADKPGGKEFRITLPVIVQGNEIGEMSLRPDEIISGFESRTAGAQKKAAPQGPTTVIAGGGTTVIDGSPAVTTGREKAPEAPIQSNFRSRNPNLYDQNGLFDRNKMDAKSVVSALTQSREVREKGDSDDTIDTTMENRFVSNMASRTDSSPNSVSITFGDLNDASKSIEVGSWRYRDVRSGRAIFDGQFTGDSFRVITQDKDLIDNPYLDKFLRVRLGDQYNQFVSSNKYQKFRQQISEAVRKKDGTVTLDFSNIQDFDFEVVVSVGEEDVQGRKVTVGGVFLRRMRPVALLAGAQAPEVKPTVPGRATRQRQVRK